MKMPKLIWVRIDDNGSDTLLLAHTQEVEAIEDDGPTTIGVYKLVDNDQAQEGRRASMTPPDRSAPGEGT